MSHTTNAGNPGPSKTLVLVSSLEQTVFFAQHLFSRVLVWKGVCEGTPHDETEIAATERKINEWISFFGGAIRCFGKRKEAPDIVKMCGYYDSFILDWSNDKRRVLKDSIFSNIKEFDSAALKAFRHHEQKLSGCWPALVAGLKISIGHLHAIHLKALTSGQTLDPVAANQHLLAIENESGELKAAIPILTCFKDATASALATERLPALIRLLEGKKWSDALKLIDSLILAPVNTKLRIDYVPAVRRIE